MSVFVIIPSTIHLLMPDCPLKILMSNLDVQILNSQLGRRDWDSTENDITAAAVPLREAVKMENDIRKFQGGGLKVSFTKPSKNDQK